VPSVSWLVALGPTESSISNRASHAIIRTCLSKVAFHLLVMCVLVHSLYKQPTMEGPESNPGQSHTGLSRRPENELPIHPQLGICRGHGSAAPALLLQNFLSSWRANLSPQVFWTVKQKSQTGSFVVPRLPSFRSGAQMELSPTNPTPNPFWSILEKHHLWGNSCLFSILLSSHFWVFH
jgi:hypothetical protein